MRDLTVSDLSPLRPSAKYGMRSLGCGRVARWMAAHPRAGLDGVTRRVLPAPRTLLATGLVVAVLFGGSTSAQAWNRGRHGFFVHRGFFHHHLFVPHRTFIGPRFFFGGVVPVPPVVVTPPYPVYPYYPYPYYPYPYYPGYSYAPYP